LADDRMLAAYDTLRIFFQPQLAELHLQGIEQQQSAHKQITLSDNHFDCLERLKRPDDPGQNTQHAPFGATRHEPGRGWRWVQAAVTRTAARVSSRGARQPSVGLGFPLGAEDGDLSFKPEDTSINIRYLQKHA